MKTIILQHAPYWHAGVLNELVEAETIHSYLNTGFPELAKVGLIIVLSGPQHVRQEEPWLNNEKAFLKKAIAAKRPILAIGLGAQIIASAIGGQVFKNPAGKELGAFPVEAAIQPLPFGIFPDELRPIHWHEDTFRLPPGAMVFYKTPFCEQQAFLHTDRIIGLQFHLEFTKSLFHDILQQQAAFIETTGYYTQSLEQLQQLQIDPSHKDILQKLINHLLGRLKFM